MQVSSYLKPLGVDLFCLGKKFLVFNLVAKNLKTKYHRSVLGIFWTLLSPLAFASVFYFVFKVVLNVQIPHYLAFVLSGMLPWAFFNQTILEGMESIVISLGLLSKVPIPIQVFPFVGAVTNLTTLSLSLPILFGAAYFSGVPLGPSVLLIPFYFIGLFLLAYSFATILAIFFVFVRDLRHVMGIVLQIWFYATPVVYRDSMIPEAYRWTLSVNPLAYIFIDLHTILTTGQFPELIHFPFILMWILAGLTGAVLCHHFFGNELVERI